tara:strand:+ start:3953 stop:5110 length:1158 start_codon:yes stop_codon:yes gene_type:complete
MSKKKKNFQPHKGNKVNQGGRFPFIENFNTWRKTCQGVSGEKMMVKNIPNLYMFLKNHMMNNIRAKSRNKGRDGQGAIQFLEPIEAFVDNDLFTEGQAQIIKTLADTLESFYLEGSDIGNKSAPARDPAFIVFTEQDYTATGQKKRPRKVAGHYATDWYAEKNKTSAAPSSWFAHIDAPDGFNGGNPPHQALFSRTKTEFANPKGLLWLMKEATEFIDDMEIEVEVDRIPEGVDEVDLDEIKSVESFFNDVVRNESFWNAGGRLLTKKVRSSLQATTFAVKPLEQKPARKITNVGKEDEKDALTGRVVSFKLTATALPIINLVDRALKRKNTKKAPNGFRAWQGDRKGGFDYRKTAREKFGEDTGRYKPEQKVISKMWQQLLWRD